MLGQEGIFFLVQPKIPKRRNFIVFQSQILKTKSLKYETKRKLTFEISIWIKTWQFDFFKCVLESQEESFFSGYDQKYCKCELLILVKVKIAGQISEVQKI